MEISTRRRLSKKWIAAGLLLLSAFLALFELWREPGWPVNHEASAMAMRVMQYVQSMRNGYLLPIWSPEESNGMGSPMALFYPRLFTMLAALPALAGIPVKVAMIGVLTFFGALGEWGCFRFFRTLRLPVPAAFLLCLTFPHLNYAYTDVVVRGATAEFTAMCLLPWLLWWCLELIRNGKFSYAIVPVGAGLFFGHTSIFLFSAPMGAGALLIGFCRHPRQRKEMLKTAFRSALLLALLLAPLLLLVVSVRESYLFELAYLYGNCPKYFFPSPETFIFGSICRQDLIINPQLDVAFLIPIFAIGGFLVCRAFRDPKYAAVCRKRRCLIGYLLGLTAIYFFLMAKWSWPVYQLFYMIFLPLQFPWRLLTYASILELFGLGLGLSLLRPLTPRRTLTAIAATVLTVTLTISLLRAPATDRIPPQEFNQKRIWNWLEYIPVCPSFDLDAQKLSITDLMGELRRKTQEWLSIHAKIPPEISGNAVRELKIDRAANNVDWDITYRAEAPFVLNLPVIWDSLYAVVLENGGRKQLLNTYRTSDNPRLHINIPRGSGSIRVIAPCWGNLIRKSIYPAVPAPE